MNIKEYYCLNDDRSNFETVIGKDDENIFGYQTLKLLLERTMNEAEVTQLPPRAVILGQNGLGKTLHLRYLDAMVKKTGKTIPRGALEGRLLRGQVTHQPSARPDAGRLRTLRV